MTTTNTIQDVVDSYQVFKLREIERVCEQYRDNPEIIAHLTRAKTPGEIQLGTLLRVTSPNGNISQCVVVACTVEEGTTVLYPEGYTMTRRGRIPKRWLSEAGKEEEFLVKWSGEFK